ncbi:MAG: acyl transferase [Chitinophagaceae bacterium]|nr:acyl transferase [Chitinophagaceae bacterium]
MNSIEMHIPYSFTRKSEFLRLQSHEFHEAALQVFRFQAKENLVYGDYLKALGISPDTVTIITEIPFLPVSFFKTHEVKTTSFTPTLIFESSRTTGSTPSRHFVKDPGWYEFISLKGFELFYGGVNRWCILALLPSYLERKNASLVKMADTLIQNSGHPQSGFYLYDFEKLFQTLIRLEETKQKTLLLGVSFALLDFAEQFGMPLQHTVVMETGGMKGRRKEITREELHEYLKKQFQLNAIHSEYGMTELFSQAYAVADGRFRCPPWMKILIRDEDDPLSLSEEGRGLLCIIDLANLYSCAFIATEDIGRLYPDGSFEVLGRADAADIRGCSLMYI